MRLFAPIVRLLRARLEARRLRAQLRAVQDGRPHRHWSVRMLARVCRACRVRVI
ncbi:hypothetical protein SAMN02799643_05564 [Methylobacterium sp. UNCCL125]|nr:hypothetical protein SAMN02799643_05564 [Methylobacterium sp. UNCCL125]